MRVPGPNGEEYQICEDWPRRGGDTYRALRRDGQGGESIVAIKFSKACGSASTSSSVGLPTPALGAVSTRAWETEVRLLRRLAMLGGHRGAGRGQKEGGAAAASSLYTVEMLTEFGGVKDLPGLRFLVTRPVCWKSLEARIKVSGWIGGWMGR